MTTESPVGAQNLLTGDCMQTLGLEFFHIKILKAVGLFPLQNSILYKQFFSVKIHNVRFVGVF